jgi:hypothetical protein
MKLILAALALAAGLTAQQTTVFKRNVFDGITTSQASAALPNIGQAVHIVTLIYPTATADVTSFTFRVEASFDNSSFFPIIDDITTAEYNGSYAYAIARCNGVFPYVRLRLVTANATYPLTAHYTGSLQPIGTVRFSNDRYIMQSPLAGAAMEGLALNLSGEYFIQGRRLTPITPGDWTSVNLGAQTTRTDGLNSILLDTGPDAGTGWNFVCRSLPASSNYTIRVHYLRLQGSAAGDNPAWTGVALRNSSTGAFVAMYQYSTQQQYLGYWATPSQGSETTLYMSNPQRMTNDLFSLQITDDGTNRIWRQWDGLTAYRFYQSTGVETQLRTAGTTPDQVCFGNRENNGNYRTVARLVGYDANPTW